MADTRKVKLLCTGGYKGLEVAVGKTFEATKYLGHWNITGAALEAAGAAPVMQEYAFFQRELEFLWQQ